MTATGPEGTAWSCVRGGAAGGEGKGLHQRVVGMEQPAQGSGHSPECQSSGSIGISLSDIGFGFRVEPRVGFCDPCGSFQLRIFQEMHFCKYMNIKAKGKISNPVCSLVRFLTMVVCA